MTATTVSTASSSPETAQPLLDVRDVHYQYHNSNAGLKNLSFHIQAGEFVCVVGSSGSGKSTLLSLLAGFLKPQSGQIWLGGSVLHGPSDKQTLVQQDHALFPWRTVRENVEFGLETKRLDKAERQKRALDAISLVGLQDKANNRIHQLSGGQRQRISIARALAVDPQLLLLDEPFSALDTSTRLKLGLELLDIWRRSQKTILFVTHHLEEALRLGQRIIVMKDGAVVREGLASEFNEKDLVEFLH